MARVVWCASDPPYDLSQAYYTYPENSINMLGGTIKDVLNKMEKRSAINFPTIRSMCALNLIHHHSVVGPGQHASVTSRKWLSTTRHGPKSH